VRPANAALQCESVVASLDLEAEEGGPDDSYVNAGALLGEGHLGHNSFTTCHGVLLHDPGGQRLTKSDSITLHDRQRTNQVMIDPLDVHRQSTSTTFRRLAQH
jgi:hypothetical protein